jgi:glycolate oxidase FAD binding subunit
MMKRLPVLRALVDICGPHFAREAGQADTVGGRQATFVAVPATTAAVSDTVRLAADRGLAVLPRGAGTKIDWGAPPAGVDLLLDTGRLAGIWHHRTEALTAEIGAGTPVRAVQAALGLRGQRLAMDPPSSGATLGGVLAVNEAGPLRHRYGPPSAQVIQVEGVDYDGAAAQGPLPDAEPPTGVVVSAIMRLEPIPDTRMWVTRSVWTPLQVHDLVATVLASDVTPAAIEIDLPATETGTGNQRPGTLAVLLEGGPVSARQAAAQMVRLLGEDAAVQPTPPAWWGRYPFTPADMAVRVTVPIADLHAAIYALRDAAGVAVPFRGSAGVGSVHAVLPATLPPNRIEAILDAVRGVLLARGGRCVAVSAPPAIREHLELASRNDLF